MPKKNWPKDCVWPEPLKNGEGDYWDREDVDALSLDEEGEDLLEIREYYDELIEEGLLNEDYSLNEEDDFRDDEEDGEFVPEKGYEYWDDGFNVDAWEWDFLDCVNRLKLPAEGGKIISDICRVIGYDFTNENLLRQAFTRRAFDVEYGVGGNSEELELLGDTVLNTVVTREIFRQLTDTDKAKPAAPFQSKYQEGELSRIRTRFICKEYLSRRAAELGLDRYILYGTGEEPGKSSREDAVEALIGAVAVDSNWNWEALANVVDRICNLQLTEPDEYLKTTYYDLFNAWHQKKFGRMPEYEVYGSEPCTCTIRFFVPENDKGIWTSQRADVKEASRSEAREEAAMRAYGFVVGHRLWADLTDAQFEPELENSINQLQELYQKKYVEKPEYAFEERDDLGAGKVWICSCLCGGVEGLGRAEGKTKAKKKAAFSVLKKLISTSGPAGGEMR